jgi:hypothetical protein
LLPVLVEKEARAEELLVLFEEELVLVVVRASLA